MKCKLRLVVHGCKPKPSQTIKLNNRQGTSEKQKEPLTVRNMGPLTIKTSGNSGNSPVSVLLVYNLRC